MFLRNVNLLENIFIDPVISLMSDFGHQIFESFLPFRLFRDFLFGRTLSYTVNMAFWRIYMIFIT